MNESLSCETLWLPPCPRCSAVALGRRPALDVLEAPGYYLARHCTAKYQQSYYMLRGCSHATALGLRLGPLKNRLFIAVRWRRMVAQLADPLWRTGWLAAQRAEVLVRLGHPSQYQPEPAPVAAVRPVAPPPDDDPWGKIGREIRQPYADDSYADED